MYRFYRPVAGASIREVDYRARTLEFPLDELLAAITPFHARCPDRQLPKQCRPAILLSRIQSSRSAQGRRTDR